MTIRRGRAGIGARVSRTVVGLVLNGLALGGLAGWCGAELTSAAELQLRVQQIADDLKVGYAVTLVDVNADGRLDIVVVDSQRVVWYENPSWQVHTIIQDQTRPDNVCIAAHDIDSDGRIDFALGADWKPFNTESGGTIQWLRRGATDEDRWEVRAIDELPTTHRMRWVDTDGDGRSELVVVPLMGRGTTKPAYSERGVEIMAYTVPNNPVTERWPRRVLNDQLRVAHNFWPTDLNRDGRIDLLVTSFEGVNWLFRNESNVWERAVIGAGNQDTQPARGASEIKRGQLKSGADFIATIEPWHGFQVVVYTRAADGHPGSMWQRQVLDDDLLWGHAVWCADLDGDGDDELAIGVRDDKSTSALRGLRIFKALDAAGQRWKRTLYDPGGVAIEDLAIGDLNGDGRPDLVASGRATKNVRIYWNER